jgi:hypothetical protein
LARPSETLLAIGLSRNTCFPAAAAALVVVRCTSFGVVLTIASTSGWTSPDLVESHSLLPCRRREPRLEGCRANVAEARVPSARVIEAFDV